MSIVTAVIHYCDKHRKAMYRRYTGKMWERVLSCVLYAKPFRYSIRNLK